MKTSDIIDQLYEYGTTRIIEVMSNRNQFGLVTKEENSEYENAYVVDYGGMSVRFAISYTPRFKQYSTELSSIMMVIKPITICNVEYNTASKSVRFDSNGNMVDKMDDNFVNRIELVFDKVCKSQKRFDAAAKRRKHNKELFAKTFHTDKDHIAIFNKNVVNFARPNGAHENLPISMEISCDTKLAKMIDDLIMAEQAGVLDKVNMNRVTVMGYPIITDENQWASVNTTIQIDEATAEWMIEGSDLTSDGETWYIHETKEVKGNYFALIEKV